MLSQNQVFELYQLIIFLFVVKKQINHCKIRSNFTEVMGVLKLWGFLSCRGTEVIGVLKLWGSNVDGRKDISDEYFHFFTCLKKKKLYLLRNLAMLDSEQITAKPLSKKQPE